jgi:hypothetical protein
MKRFCDYCNRSIPYEETIYELRIENRDQGILDTETLCEHCLGDHY